MNPTRGSAFGDVLRQLREAAGLSQERLAERAGLSSRGISDLERGARTTPRLETVRMLADALALNEAERIELMSARGHGREFPRLTDTYSSPNFPLLPNAFIGRIQEIEKITSILRDDNVRLLTLTGPGGVGKTRIAIEVAHRLADDYPDGATFVDLSPIRDPEMVIPAMAARLGVTGQPDRTLRDVLAGDLRNQRLMIVLDNCEQVIDAATDIALLLGACPNLTIIATSRMLLRISAEHVVPVDPMEVSVAATPGELAQTDALQLFTARASAVDPGFTVDHETLPAVVAMVTRLEGMPLAIELAAARTRVFSPAEILVMLESQLPVLTGGVRDAPSRQRTMRDTIAWSYELLSSTEQQVFRTLAVFPVGCLLETAEAVLAVDGRLTSVETLTAVESLVDSSLLRKREGPEGLVWYRMLQTVREFGLEQLATADEEAMARGSAHSAWCQPLARKAEFAIARPNPVFWLNRIEHEYPNLRDHVSWLIDHELMEDALDISWSLSVFRIVRGHMAHGSHELEMLLAHPRNQSPTIVRMKGLIGMGLICRYQTESLRAFEMLEAGVGLARQLGEMGFLAMALLNIGSLWADMGRPDKAEAFLQEAYSIAVAAGDSFQITELMVELQFIAAQRGHLDQSLEMLHRALSLDVASGNIWGTAVVKLNLCWILRQMQEFDQAEAYIREAEQLFVELGDRSYMPMVYLNRAHIALQRNHLHDAQAMFEQALGSALEYGSMRDTAIILSGFAKLMIIKGDPKTAEILTYDAIYWFERCSNLTGAIDCLNNLASVALINGNGARAAWCLGAVDDVLAKRGIAHEELFAGEHQLLVDKVKSMLGESEFLAHYARGKLTNVDKVLPEVRRWNTGAQAPVLTHVCRIAGNGVHADQ